MIKMLDMANKIGTFKEEYSLLFLLFLFVNCTSVEKYNYKLEQPIAIEKLQKDVDYAQHKLEKLHPSLYKYISKEKLDGKFDSVRRVIYRPMTSKEFFFLISPAIASVHQGHMIVSPVFKKSNKNNSDKPFNINSSLKVRSLAAQYFCFQFIL